MRGLLSFCAINMLIRIIKVQSLVNRITFKQQVGINSISKRSLIFSEFHPSDIAKLENVGLMLSNFRPPLSYSSVATTVVNNSRD